jgi:hypothetical protein
MLVTTARPSDVAGVSPDEADDRSHDEHGDHRSEPQPVASDDAEPTPMTEFRQSKRQALVRPRLAYSVRGDLLGPDLRGQAGELALGTRRSGRPLRSRIAALVL